MATRTSSRSRSSSSASRSSGGVTSSFGRLSDPGRKTGATRFDESGASSLSPERQRQIELEVETEGRAGQGPTGARAEQESKLQQILLANKRQRLGEIIKGVESGRYELQQTSRYSYRVIERAGPGKKEVVIASGLRAAERQQIKKPTLALGVDEATGQTRIIVEGQRQAPITRGTAEARVPVKAGGEELVPGREENLPPKLQKKIRAVEKLGNVLNIRRRESATIKDGALTKESTLADPIDVGPGQELAIGIPSLTFGKFVTKPLGTRKFKRLPPQEQGNIFVTEIADIATLGIPSIEEQLTKGGLRRISTLAKTRVGATSARAEASEIGGLSELEFRNLFGKKVGTKSIGFRGATIAQQSEKNPLITSSRTRLSKVLDLDTGKSLTRPGRRPTRLGVTKQLDEQTSASISEDAFSRAGEFSRKADDIFTLSRGKIQPKPKGAIIESEAIVKRAAPPKETPIEIPGRQRTIQTQAKVDKRLGQQINKEIEKVAPKTIDTGVLSSETRRLSRQAGTTLLGGRSTQAQIQRQEQKFITGIAQKQRERITPIVRPRQEVIPKPQEILRPKSIQITRPISQQKQKQKSLQQQITTPFNPLNPGAITRGGGIGGVGGGVNLGSRRLGPGRTRLSRQPKAISPGFTQAALKRFGKPVKKKFFTGLEGRPVPTEFKGSLNVKYSVNKLFGGK